MEVVSKIIGHILETAYFTDVFWVRDDQGYLQYLNN